MCTVECDPVLAAARNVHKRSEAEVVKLARAWEDTPGEWLFLGEQFLMYIYHIGFLNFEIDN